MDILRIGLISDTHGLLRPEARIALRGSAHILHAGDICDASVLDKLAEIAPVTAVRGNNDRGDWAEKLPERVTVEFGGVRICMVHDAADAPEPIEADVIVTGHSHKPAIHRAGRADAACEPRQRGATPFQAADLGRLPGDFRRTSAGPPANAGSGLNLHAEGRSAGFQTTSHRCPSGSWK